MFRRHWPALAIATAVLAAGLNLQAQPPAARLRPPRPRRPPAHARSGRGCQPQGADRPQQAPRAAVQGVHHQPPGPGPEAREERPHRGQGQGQVPPQGDRPGRQGRRRQQVHHPPADPDREQTTSRCRRSPRPSRQNDDLIKVLREILAILQSDDELARIKAEKEFLEKLLADLNILDPPDQHQPVPDRLRPRRPEAAGEGPGQARQQGRRTGRQDGCTKTGGRRRSSEPKGGAKGQPKEGDDPQGEHKEDTKDPKVDERENGDKTDPMKSDGAEGKRFQGRPADGRGQGRRRAPPSDGAAKPEPKKEPGDKTANKPAEKRNKEDNKGDRQGHCRPSGDQSGQREEPGLAERRIRVRHAEAVGQPVRQPPPPKPNQPKAPGPRASARPFPDEENAAERPRREQAAQGVRTISPRPTRS